MKIKRILLLSFAVLPLIVSLIALIFLPEEIPAHYGADLTVDRYGSKFEILIFPFIILITGFIFLICAKFMKDESNQKITLNIGFAIILFFNALSDCLLYIQANNITDIQSFGLNRFLLLAFGILFIFIGNIMPMTRRNSFVGLRTKWSRKNDWVWKKCQIFGGVTMMIAGIVCCIFAFVYPELYIMIAVILTVCLIDVVYTYFSAKNDVHEAD